MAQKRGPDGRFLKGGAGGPGRPPAAREIEYWAIARTACSLDDWAAILKAAVDAAKNGDSQARKWLAEILIGDPHKLRARQAAAQAKPAGSVADVAQILAGELASVGRFDDDPRRAAMVARVADSLLRALEVGDLTQKMERIEDLLREMSA